MRRARIFATPLLLLLCGAGVARLASAQQTPPGKAAATQKPASEGSTQQKSASDEIPIEFCDKLPVVVAQVEGRPVRLLLDTAATTILNIKSFNQGASKSIQISSWSGTSPTSAREVSLSSLNIGLHRIENIRLPAVDLSPIGKACGGQIDGILGMDLLDALRAKIDLERRVARLGAAERVDEHADVAGSGYERLEQACIDAFNRADVAALAQCFDAEIVMFAPDGEYRGPKQVIDYLKRRWFSGPQPAHFAMKLNDVRTLGDVHWHGYDFTITAGAEIVRGKGTSLCRLHNGRWQMLSMHNSVRSPDVKANGAP